MSLRNVQAPYYKPGQQFRQGRLARRVPLDTSPPLNRIARYLRTLVYARIWSLHLVVLVAVSYYVLWFTTVSSVK